MVYEKTDSNDMGLRQPRSVFEKKLRKILQRVASSEWSSFAWKAPLWSRAEFCTGQARATSLWVVGSFARGSEKCGDLDLVLQAEVKCNLTSPNDKRLTNTLTGVHQYVRTYLGTPDENSSHVGFDEAVLLWSIDHPNWEQALASIKVSPDVGRFEREVDCIPISMEQVYIPDPDELIALKKNGVIDWEWVSWSELEQIKPDLTNSQAHIQRITRDRSSKFADAFKLAANWLSHKVPLWAWDDFPRKGWPLHAGGYSVAVSPRPSVCLSYLDSLTCHSIIVMPYKTKRGPNGIWVISRGLNHPLVKEFEKIKVYAPVDINGVFHYRDKNDANYSKQIILSKGPHIGFHPVSGKELLDLLATVTSVHLLNTKQDFNYSSYYRMDPELALLDRLKKWAK